MFRYSSFFIIYLNMKRVICNHEASEVIVNTNVHAACSNLIMVTVTSKVWVKTYAQTLL